MSYPEGITKTIKPFDYVQASSAREAASLLHELGEQAKVLAGGTDLIPLMKKRSSTPKVVIDLKGIKGISEIQVEKDFIRIGALTTVTQILASADIGRIMPSLQAAAMNFAYPQVRNVATIGGNICRSSPSADTIPPLLTFDAQVEITGKDGARTIALKDFFKGPGANVLGAEIVTAILVPIPQPPSAHYGCAFGKITRNSADLAKVNAAAKLEVKDGKLSGVRVAIGAVAPTPVRAVHVEQALEGKPAKLETIEEVVEKEVLKDISPITDVRSDAEYRKDVSQVLVKRVLWQSVESL